jgi:hypothetical protein
MTRDGFASAQSDDLAPAGDPAHLTYVLMGAMSMFSQAAEFSLTTGHDPREAKAVESYVDLVLRLLLPGTLDGDNASTRA